MNAAEKNRLSKEAEMQIHSLHRIGVWRTIAIAFSTLGVAITYAGLAGRNQSIFLGILGIILIIVSVCFAIVFNLGIKNGKRNVEKILDALNGK